MTVSELALLSNFSKAYISQVKHGQRPPSKKLLKSLIKLPEDDKRNGADLQKAINLFIQSRREGT
jgi:transcriptional regulator with XRE-family HTH domain